MSVPSPSPSMPPDGPPLALLTCARHSAQRVFLWETKEKRKKIEREKETTFVLPLSFSTFFLLFARPKAGRLARRRGMRVWASQRRRAALSVSHRLCHALPFFIVLFTFFFFSCDLPTRSTFSFHDIQTTRVSFRTHRSNSFFILRKRDQGAKGKRGRCGKQKRAAHAGLGDTNGCAVCLRPVRSILGTRQYNVWSFKRT